MSQALFGPIDQIGYLVDDLDAAIARWIKSMGVGPWTVFRNVSLNGHYRGQEGVVTMDVGLAYQGNVQIELIKVTNGAPSPYRAGDGTAILGLHHLAWVVDDLGETIARAEARGLRVAYQARNPGTHVAYMESPEEPGVYYELIEGEGMRAMIDNGVVATREWDGTNPVHVIDFSAAS